MQKAPHYRSHHPDRKGPGARAPQWHEGGTVHRPTYRRYPRMSLALHTDIPDNPRPTSRSPRFFRDSRWRHFATLSVLLCLTDPAWAANSGGSVDTDCDPSGSSYIGTCGLDSTPATGGDVHIDTHTGPPVLNLIGGMTDGGGAATGNPVRVGGIETQPDKWHT